MKWEEENATDPVELPQYPNRSGVYIITDSNDKVLYIGQSKQLSRRVSHLTALQKDKRSKTKYSHLNAGKVRRKQDKGETLYVRFIKCKDHKKCEKELLKKYKTRWNERGKTALCTTP